MTSVGSNVLQGTKTWKMLPIAENAFSFSNVWKGLTACLKVYEETCFTISSCCWQQPQQVFPVYLIQGGHHLASEYGMCRDSRTETKQLENAEI